MIKKILLPTDFSKNSWCAIQYAINLYENQECDFYILNTYTKDSYGSDSNVILDPDKSFNKLAKDRSREGLGDILRRLSKVDKKIAHRFHVLSRAGVLLDEINTLVNTLDITIIVIGAKGMSSKGKETYGKNTLAIMNSMRKCPVLVVPVEVTFDRPEEIVLATNFDSDFNISEVKHLAEIARISNARLQILSLADNKDLSPKQRKNKILLREQLIGIEHGFVVLHNVEMSAALSCFVEIRHSNMISYIDKKPSIWERLGFGKSIFSKLGYYANIPVLTLRG